MGHYVSFHDACKENDTWFFSAINMNGLFSYNSENRLISHINAFEKEPLNAVNLHRKIIKYGGKMYFIPYYGKYVAVYNPQDNTLEYIRLSNSTICISDAILIGEEIIIIPAKRLNYFGKIDLKNNEYTPMNALASKLSELADGEFWCDVFGVQFDADNNIYFAIYNSDVIVKINIEKGTYEKIKIGKNNQSMIIDGRGTLWVVSIDNIVYSYNHNTEDIKIYEFPQETLTRSLYRIVDYNDSLILLPCYGKTIYKYSYESNRWEEIWSIGNDEFKRIVENETLFWGAVECDGRLVLLPKSGNGFLILDNDSVSFSDSLCENMSDSVLISAMTENSEEIIFEDSFLDVDVFVKSII